MSNLTVGQVQAIASGDPQALVQVLQSLPGLALTPAFLKSLPTTPGVAGSGTPYNNNGVFCIS